MQKPVQKITIARQKWLTDKGFNREYANIYWQLTPTELVEVALQKKEGVLSDQGALVCDTGKFTGRSPKDRFIVKDKETKDTIWWGATNQPFSPEKFDMLYQKMVHFLQKRDLYVRDAYAGVLPPYQLSLRIVTTLAWHNLFCHHLFLRPTKLSPTFPAFTIINAPEFCASPAIDSTSSPNFTIINFTKKIILIGGTAYAGEIKKGVFSMLNYLLPYKHHIFPMHCAANAHKKSGATAIFFGLSGTGKTTLSAAPERSLIGDDEHGWYDKGIFNFEGGCYAKTVALTKKSEPQIFNAIQFGAILENMRFVPGTRTIDYNNVSVTENLRSAYPITHIENAVTPSVGKIPQHIFFLTCDAYGILPPIARLTKSQAMYHFITGYTSKIAGTEVGITAPVATFSACFGAAFLPLHPVTYAKMLGEKLTSNQICVWLVNTGWIGGSYGIGKRIDLAYTRAIITAALSNALNDVSYINCPIFGIAMLKSCPGVPESLLNPGNMWPHLDAYTLQARQLAISFMKNFKQYESLASDAILAGGPTVEEENID